MKAFLEREADPRSWLPGVGAIPVLAPVHFVLYGAVRERSHVNALTVSISLGVVTVL